MRLIDADDLANKVADLYSEGEEATGADKVVNDVIDLIDNAPTIKPTITCKECDGYEAGYSAGQHDARPKGEWVMNKISARGRNYTCTNCQKVSRSKSEFCQKCGAVMRVKND